MWVMREWVRQKSPVRKDKVKPFTPTWRIHDLDNDAEFSKKAADANAGSKDAVGRDIAARTTTEDDAINQDEEEKRKTLVFNEALDRLGRDQGAKGIVRYQLNPRENWGPMTKARGQ
jgi:tRNA (guanine26-N2/guanine27-N2)-dimethyltransferase